MQHAQGAPQWQKYGARKKRDLSSVHLPRGVMEDLLGDVEWFLGASRWYHGACANEHWLHLFEPAARAEGF